MRRRLWIQFVFILLLFGLTGFVSWPSTQRLTLNNRGRDVSLRQGLDLKGGAHLVYEADTSKIENKDLGKAMNGVRDIIELRVNALGVSEPEIRQATIGNKPAIIIDLPGVSDVSKAKGIIGTTAKLTFKTANDEIILEGKDLVPGAANAAPQQSGGSGSASLGNNWEINLSLNSEGKIKFAKATSENIGQQIGIFLDDQLISAPTVQSAITDGQAVITGDFTVQDAKDFALKLNYGALPVPINLVQEQTVGASLGSDAVSQGLLAGVIGIILIFLFMIGYYRWLGIIACLALIVYATLNIAIYKLMPVTLTMAGIAGFIISMGIAIDTNILTFERLKEELRLKKPMPVAIQEAFRRAWSSIRDSHIAGLISSSIIFLFGSGGVKGFALVIFIGTLLSLFSAITVTKTWMLLLAGSRLQRLLNPNPKTL